MTQQFAAEWSAGFRDSRRVLPLMNSGLMSVQHADIDGGVCVDSVWLIPLHRQHPGVRNLIIIVYACPSLSVCVCVCMCVCSLTTVVLNLGSRDPLGVPNANLGGPKRKSGISTNFPQYFCLALVTSCFCVHTTHPILFSQPVQSSLPSFSLSSLSLRAGWLGHLACKNRPRNDL